MVIKNANMTQNMWIFRVGHLKLEKKQKQIDS